MIPRFAQLSACCHTVAKQISTSWFARAGPLKPLLLGEPMFPLNNQVRSIAKWKMAKRKRMVYRPYMKPKKKYEDDQLRLRLILKTDVEGYGSQGDVILVSPKIGRQELILNQLAEYAIPENLEKWGITEFVDQEVQKSTIPDRLLNFLESARFTIRAPLLPSANEGEEEVIFITRHDICQQLAANYQLHVPIHCITVLGHGLDNPIECVGEYSVQITINGMHSATIPMEVKSFHRVLTEEEDTEEVLDKDMAATR